MQSDEAEAARDCAVHGGGAVLGVGLPPDGRTDSFPDVVSAIRAYSGKSLPAFFAVPKIYFPLILLAMVNIWDNLSWISRDKGA